MRHITVACRKRDTRAFTAQKYENDEPWNVVGGTAPNGVHATRYLRKTEPDTARLSSLAAWLVENVPICVAGTMPAMDGIYKVRCFNGRTAFEQILHEAETKKTVNGRYYKDKEDSVRAAHDLYNAYGSILDQPQRIDDWLFSIIEPDQNDTDYWNAEAQTMLDAGTTAVETNGKRWEIKR